jgi:hypothetical protein
MMRIGVMLCFLVAACGGTNIPQHGGYKSPKSKPWDKPKVLKLDKNAAKTDADLDYGRYKRARWFAVDLPGSGSLDVKMEVTPGGPGSDEDLEQDMDVALEVALGQHVERLGVEDLRAATTVSRSRTGLLRMD